MGRRSSGEIIVAYVKKEKVMSSEFLKTTLLTYLSSDTALHNEFWNVVSVSSSCGWRTQSSSNLIEVGGETWHSDWTEVNRCHNNPGTPVFLSSLKTPAALHMSRGREMAKPVLRHNFKT